MKTGVKVVAGAQVKVLVYYFPGFDTLTSCMVPQITSITPVVLYIK